MNDLQKLIAVLNSAMEHVPPQTAAILRELAQPAVQGLEKALKDMPQG